MQPLLGVSLSGRALFGFAEPSPQAVSALRVTNADACALRALMRHLAAQVNRAVHHPLHMPAV